MTEIEQYIESYFGIRKNNLSVIANLFEARSLEKGDFLLKAGQYSRNLSFLKSGYLRIYASSKAGEKEVTQWISTKGNFVTDLASFMFQQPARWSIQALSPCELYSISEEKYGKIGDYISEWQELEKLFISKCFVMLENRIFSHLSLSAEERYQLLFEQNPDLFNHVPLHYLASMLGMTPETFSRIRKKRSS